MHEPRISSSSHSMRGPDHALPMKRAPVRSDAAFEWLGRFVCRSSTDFQFPYHADVRSIKVPKAPVTYFLPLRSNCDRRPRGHVER